MPRDEILYRRYVENVLKRIMYKNVLTTNPLKREEKDFFYVDLLRGSKNRRTLPNINTLKREESIPTRAFDTPLTSTKPITNRSIADCSSALRDTTCLPPRRRRHRATTTTPGRRKRVPKPPPRRRKEERKSALRRLQTLLQSRQQRRESILLRRRRSSFPNSKRKS